MPEYREVNYCSCGNICEGRTNFCATCNHTRRKSNRIKAAEDNKPIAKASQKQSTWNSRYFKRVAVWKRGKTCAATFEHDCSHYIECHHMAGRSVNAFHDEYAEEKGIPELMDERFWKPLCSVAHAYVTEHSRWASENGYSFLKVSDRVFHKQV